ncbi:MAG TPA: 16S rRNA (adenine(1518)-N(6)/adenine(1519)-N(6))-dimethyltransferase RsmA [Desulfobacteria bacterium]|nr:16S rRNA (adenine(1518)-N(6)/adenine(1519)-N(6))-dimethyltransferase RsmA [Desulfobacteria bacterium]
MDIRSILIERGIRPTRSLGQYFLVDDGVASRMVEYASVGHGDVVLEIGAGVGSLTEKLNQHAKRVYAVEKDRNLCALLQECYGRENSNTEVMECDIMKLELPEFDKVVASLPFLISSPITYKLLLREAGFGLAVLLYQKEFAQKLVAKPRSNLYGRLSVISQALAEIEIMEIVHRDAFYPPAPVKGAIVRLRENENCEIGDKRTFFEFVTAAFDQRRKKLRAIFKKTRLGGLKLPALDKRPEELRPEEFVTLMDYF